MKVLSLSTVFPSAAQPTHGLFVFERLKHLARSADVRVVAPVPWRVRWRRPIPHEEVREGVAVHHPTFFYLPGVLKSLDGWFLFASVVITARRLRRRFDFDVIDAHFAFPEGFAAALLAAWTGRPFTITMRGTEIPLSRYALRRRAVAWALRRATRVIAVADPLARHAASLGVPRERIAVIPNGVDGDRFRPAPQAIARRALGMEPEDVLLVSVGHLSARKGFQRVIRAIPDLRASYPRLKLVIVGGPGGEPDNRDDLERLARDLAVERHVVFAGPQPPSSVAQWLNAADLFVLASDYEGCPNVVLEALSCGRPVVATRVGNVETLVPRYAGRLVSDPEDIRELTTALAEGLAAPWDTGRIRAHATARSWADVARRVAEEWRAAIEPARTMPSSSRARGQSAAAAPREAPRPDPAPIDMR